MPNARRRRRPVHAAIALIERRGRYLICQRRADDTFGGCWEFPGGKRETGESWDACLRRELAEELGVIAGTVRPYASFRHQYPDGAIFVRVFRCDIARGTPKPLESQRLRWVPSTQLSRYQFPPANRRLIEKLSELVVVKFDG